MMKVLTPFLLVGFAATADAQSCEEIRFSAGSSSGEVSGTVIEGAPMCFTFGSGAGQIATLNLSGSDNACFGIDGVVDCSVSYQFQTERQTYRVRVNQLFPRPEVEPFVLRLEIQ